MSSSSSSTTFTFSIDAHGNAIRDENFSFNIAGLSATIHTHHRYFTDDDTRLLEIWVTNVCCRAQWHLMVLIAGISSNGILMHTTNLLLPSLFLAKLTLHVISCISTYWTHYSPSHSLSDSVSILNSTNRLLLMQSKRLRNPQHTHFSFNFDSL